MSVSSVTSISVTISWTLGHLTAISYVITYSTSNKSHCFNNISSSSSNISGQATQYRINDLEDGTEYSVVVTASQSDGEITVVSISATTIAVGKLSGFSRSDVHIIVLQKLSHSQLHLPLPLL